MIARQTVLILGAGASMDYGFPSGAGLVAEVIVNAQANQPLSRALLDCGHGADAIERFRVKLVGANPPSIDVFIAANPQFGEIGKDAIAGALVPYEIPREGTVKAFAGRDDWYRYLFSNVMQAHEAERVLQTPVSVITFNFDRSFEFAFVTWLRDAFPLTESEADSFASRLEVTHVNGQLGGCPWLNQPNARPYNPVVPAAGDLKGIARGLRLIGEGAEDVTARTVKAQLQKAEQVFFLGFGYHEANLHWLQKHKLGVQTSERRCLMAGTSYQLPVGRQTVIESDYQIITRRCQCRGFIDLHREFWEPSK